MLLIEFTQVQYVLDFHSYSLKYSISPKLDSLQFTPMLTTVAIDVTCHLGVCDIEKK